MTEEGIYLAAEVDDNDVNMDADSVGGMWSKDSMQFAFEHRYARETQTSLSDSISEEQQERAIPCLRRTLRL